jgi:hypothetical protein
MNYVNIAIGGFVVALGFFSLELLIHRRSFSIIFLVSAILFLLGIINALFYINGFESSFSTGLLLCPLITLGYFRLCRRIFLKRFSREPKDTFLIWSTKGLGKDILFNLIYFIPSIWSFILSAVIDKWLLTFTGK